MCTDSPLIAAACLIAGIALIAFLTRLDAWRETNRRQTLIDDFLGRYEQAQHRWVDSPVVDVERRA